MSEKVDINLINRILDNKRLRMAEALIRDYLAGDVKDIIDSNWLDAYQILTVVQSEINNPEEYGWVKGD